MNALPHVPLSCKSAYSFLEGASHPEELVEKAHRLGLPSLALTDRDGVYGVVRAHKRAQELGVHLILGADVTISNTSTRLLLLAKHRHGYANLCRLLSLGRLRSPKGLSWVTWQEVCEHAGGLLALWRGGARTPLGDLKDAFGNDLYAFVVRHREAAERRREHLLREEAQRYGLLPVAGTEVLYHVPERRPLHDVMTCIHHGVTLSTAGRRLQPNAEHALRSPAEFAALFQDDPNAVRRTLRVAERCTFSLSEIRYRYPMERLPDGSTAREWLRQLTWEGAHTRYPRGIPEDVTRQVEKELTLLHKLEYEGYFLTMHEIVRFCRHHDILCQGRGSAANSAVCYCLGITAVDPVRMGLLFERFLSEERAEPPDIDLDIEHDRREEAIQHVYAKYGRSHAAMVANFIRYRPRSAIRDVGKALGLKETTIERFARTLSHYETPTAEHLKAAGLSADLPLFEHLLRLVGEIEGMPRHLSIHPGGFLLGHEPVDTLVPVENATMPDRTVIQWDKEDIEELGLFKVDLLGLGALNVVHRALDLIRDHTGTDYSLATIPPEDPATFASIQKGDTVGVFQIESRAQMAMLPRLKPRNYYDLVIEVSIVRPGPITGGMVHPYLRRRNGEEPVTYPHPCLEPVLKKTLGIPLFQEQVMKLAVVAADYTPGEADQLRRDMAAWKKSGRIERHRKRLIGRMMKKGIQQEFAERVFEQIRGFGDYGFPESHAASFALIAYATAWLKEHYPAAFLCAMLNAQPMGFYNAATLIEDGKHHGLTIRPVDVQFSHEDCTLEPAGGSGEGFAVRMGLRYVKGLPAAEARRIVTLRGPEGYASLADFTRRTRIDRGPLTRLAESGALATFQGHRRAALWDALGNDTGDRDGLLLETAKDPAVFQDLNPFETIHWDYAAMKHSARGHPLAPLREELTRQDLPDAATVRGLRNGSPVRYAGVVICRQRPGTAKGVVFMTLEDETGFVNLVIWENVFKEYALLVKTQSFLGVTGRIQSQDGVTHLVARELWVPEVRMDPYEAKSRDFH